MNILIIILGLITIISAPLPQPDEWNAYKQRHKKNYESEDFSRQIIYSLNKIRINEHNQRFSRGQVKYKLGINQFTDMTQYQYNRMLGRTSLPLARQPLPTIMPTSTTAPENPSFPLPIYRNWTSDGAVTPVKDQGLNCNSAWAFAALAALESHHFVQFTTLPPSLSAQNIIDCAGMHSSCTGMQIPNRAFEYIEKKQNVNSELAYPYDGIVSTCHYDANDVGTTLGSYEEINENDDAQVERIVGFDGPVVVGFDPFSFEFQHYESGIFEQPAAIRNYYEQTNRFYMTVVGYGHDELLKENYWILKNSMGVHWGEQGYIRVVKNFKNPIAKSASFPNV